MANWAGVQDYMRGQKIDAWLVYDFRGNNSVFAQVLPGKRWTTRRAALFIPASGEPSLIMHGIDEHQFKNTDVKQTRYLSWQDFRTAGFRANRYSITTSSLEPRPRVHIRRPRGSEYVCHRCKVWIYKDRKRIVFRLPWPRIGSPSKSLR